MKVVTKLRAAFALYIALLVVLLAYHVSTIRRVVRSGHELAQISTRVRATSTEQVARISQLSETAQKYWVTHDIGYLRKFRELHAAYDAELRHLQELPLSRREREEMTALAAAWDSLSAPAQRLAEFMMLPSRRATEDSLAKLQTALEAVQWGTRRVGEASQSVMEARIVRSADAASVAERLSWLAAGGTLLLSLLASALIARSITEPLQRLTVGTHAVAQGQFDYRLDAARDDEFAQVARDFNTMTARLGELDQMKKDFVSKVSHDLKTPLTSMRETISALLDELPGPLTEQQRRLLEINRQSGDRLSAMLSKLLNLSQLEAGIPLQRVTIDVTALAREAATQMDGARNERGVRIETNLPSAPILLDADADGIRQVIDNLLENAIKFSPANQAVALALRTVDTRPAEVSTLRWTAMIAKAPAAVAPPKHAVVWLTVTDHGPGVPDAHKERIFERFYQSDTGRAVARRGVGLGLTICREIVAAHGGVIWVADTPGGGSQFQILLPGAIRAFSPPAPVGGGTETLS